MPWEWIIPIAIVVAIVVAVGIYLWASYNSLVALNARVNEAWNDIVAQLTRRADVAPELVSTVRGYAPHEQATFAKVDRACQEARAATTPSQAARAEGEMQQALRSLFSAAEAYPQLQASQSFLQLQQALADSGDKIQASRRFYNGGVREFNTRITVVPSRFFAKKDGFHTREFFEVENGAAVSEAPRVQF